MCLYTRKNYTFVIPDRNNRFFVAKVSSKYESFNSNKQELTKCNSIDAAWVFSEIKNEKIKL